MRACSLTTASQLPFSLHPSPTAPCAGAYKRLGLLPASPAAKSYLPKHFSSESLSSRRALPLSDGVRLGHEHTITFSFASPYSPSNLFRRFSSVSGPSARESRILPKPERKSTFSSAVASLLNLSRNDGVFTARPSVVVESAPATSSPSAAASSPSPAAAGEGGAPIDPVPVGGRGAAEERALRLVFAVYLLRRWVRRRQLAREEMLLSQQPPQSPLESMDTVRGVDDNELNDVADVEQVEVKVRRGQ